jgi:hypothetical protein
LTNKKHNSICKENFKIPYSKSLMRKIVKDFGLLKITCILDQKAKKALKNECIAEVQKEISLIFIKHIEIVQKKLREMLKMQRLWQ